MKNYNGKSLIDIAEEILIENKAHTNMYELFDVACERKGIVKESKNKLIAQFYTDMISSARFVYLGDNEWDLKENQEITLWEKDGSFYKEYNKVEVPLDEEAEPKKPTKAAIAKAAKKAEKEATIKAEKEAVLAEKEALAAIEEAKAEEKKASEIKTPIIPIEDVIPEQSLEFEEELFEEVEDDFDEEKYNEYMDTYEDQYED